MRMTMRRRSRSSAAPGAPAGQADDPKIGAIGTGLRPWPWSGSYRPAPW
jgi:hypothetical protein